MNFIIYKNDCTAMTNQYQLVILSCVSTSGNSFGSSVSVSPGPIFSWSSTSPMNLNRIGIVDRAGFFG